jgi:hypothetical protein
LNAATYAEKAMPTEGSQKPEGLLPALKVRQWLPEWEDVEFGDSMRQRPEDHFLLLSMEVGQLRRLSGIERRSTEGGSRRSADEAIQRRHNPKRSDEIRRFVAHGYPWSDLSGAQQKSGEYDDLKMPGWLPTAIIVNIVKPGDERRGRTVADEDLVEVVDDGNDGHAYLQLPAAATEPDWAPEGRFPLEVIDGQHRLWAFRPEDDLSFELPVVAFYGLDLSWQAYVFWTVNIKPKRINTSLAFDLYPLLRTVDWLERPEGLRVYREARAQELTETLWAMEDSPWHERINMLGEGRWGVSQAAWIRSLLATFIKSFRGRGVMGGIGGLYGADVGEGGLVLPWTRPQQAAFLILGWQALERAIVDRSEPWMEVVREEASLEESKLPAGTAERDAAFAGRRVLLDADQGVRAVLHMLNDLTFVQAEGLGLFDWAGPEEESEDDLRDVAVALEQLRNLPVAEFVNDLADSLAEFDWRTSSAPGLDAAQQMEKSAYRGSGGYRILREALLRHLMSRGSNEIAATAREVAVRLDLEA